MYTEEKEQNWDIHFDSDKNIILKILKSDAVIIKENPNNRIDVSYNFINNYNNYLIQVRKKDKNIQESKGEVQYSRLQFLPKSEPLISIRESNPNAIITLQLGAGRELDGLDNKFLNYKVNSYGSIEKVEPTKILINSEKGADAIDYRTIGHTWAVHKVGFIINPTTNNIVETFRATKVQRFITQEVFESIKWAIAINKILKGKKVPAKYNISKDDALNNYIRPLNKKMGLNISKDSELALYIQHFVKLTQLGIEKINIIKKAKNENWNFITAVNSNIGYQILLFEQGFNLNELIVLNHEFIVQNTSKMGLRANRILCYLCNNGVKSYLTSEGNEGTYHDFLMDNLFTDILVNV